LCHDTLYICDFLFIFSVISRIRLFVYPNQQHRQFNEGYFMHRLVCGESASNAKSVKLPS